MSGNLLVLGEVKKTLRTPFSRKPGFPVGPLNLTIGPAEIVGLIGANGAGKTTTIKLILGLLVPEAGRVELVGTPSTSNAWRSQVGYLPEQPAFYDYLSGLEFMRFVGELFGLRGEALNLKVNHLLDRVGLSDSAPPAPSDHAGDGSSNESARLQPYRCCSPRPDLPPAQSEPARLE